MGAERKVICWPNRNGFYYVLDRVTGQFLTGTPFVEINWAQGLTSRGTPIPANSGTLTAGGRITKPGVIGGVNWQPSAFDPARGLIFVQAIEGQSVFTKSAGRIGRGISRGGKGIFAGSGGSMVGPVTKVVRALDAATGTKRWEYRSPNGRTAGRSAACSRLRERWYLGPPEARCSRWTRQLERSFGHVGLGGDTVGTADHVHIWKDGR